MKSPCNRSPGLSGLGPSMSASLLLHPPLNYLSFRAILRFDGNPSLPNHGSRPLILSAFPPRACSSIHHRASHRGLFWSKRNHFLRQFLRYAWRPPAVGFVGDQFCSGNHNFSVTDRCVRDYQRCSYTSARFKMNQDIRVMEQRSSCQNVSRN